MVARIIIIISIIITVSLTLTYLGWILFLSMASEDSLSVVAPLLAVSVVTWPAMLSLGFLACLPPKENHG